MLKWLRSLASASAVVGMILSALIGGLAGYFSDYFKEVRGVNLERTTKFAFSGDEYSAAARKYIVALAANKDLKHSQQEFADQVARQFSESRQLLLISTNNQVKYDVRIYTADLQILAIRLQKPTSAADLKNIIGEIDAVASSRRSLSAALLKAEGIPSSREE